MITNKADEPKTANDRALALVMARFLATHRLFFFLNLLQLAVCLCIFANFAVIAGFLAVFAGLFYLHVRLYFDTLIFRDFADERLGQGEFDAGLLELNLTNVVNLKRTREPNLTVKFGAQTLAQIITRQSRGSNDDSKRGS